MCVVVSMRFRINFKGPCIIAGWGVQGLVQGLDERVCNVGLFDKLRDLDGLSSVVGLTYHWVLRVLRRLMHHGLVEGGGVSSHRGEA
jgi:hypothetical protein